jgi:polysaccharide biosynthesis protein PslH
MPFPPLDGGAQVMHYTTRGLIASQIEVKTLAINPTRNLIDVSTLPDEYRKSTRFESVTVDTRIKLIRAVINLFGKESYLIQRFISRDFERQLQAVFESGDYDVIQLEHLYLCKYIATIRAFSRAKIVLRPQNIEYVIWERYLKGLKNPLKKWFLDIAVSRLRTYEQSVNDQLNGIIALTKDDAALFSSFSDTTPVIVVPMGYDYDNLDDYDFQKQFEIPPVVYHLGSMDWLPNLEAVTWFFEQVYPVIRERGCPVKFSIAGSNMPSWVYKHRSEHLEVLGAIEKPLVYQEDKPIMMVPLWSGSGIRAKIIEGLALGKTIISTTIGAQGIEYEVGKNILIADTPCSFADQIIRCYQSPGLCREIGQNARKLGESHYHFRNTAKKMVGFYKQLLA